MQHQDREDLVAVDDLAARVDREHPVAVAIERHAEVGAGASDSLLQSREVGGAAADVDVHAVGLAADRRHLGAEALEGGRRDPRVGPVGAVDHELQTGEVGAEALDDVVEVALLGDVHVVDLAGAPGEGDVEECLDLLLGRVGELAALAVEELDAVVLRRVVRGGDDCPEVEREQRDGRRRQHAREHRVPSRGHDTPAERLLQLLARLSRVAPDEDAPPVRPERRRPAELLDELRRQVLPDDPPDPVGTEVAAQISAWRTAAPCAPCAGRPSCARRSARRASGSRRA